MKGYWHKNFLENPFVIALVVLGVSFLIWELKGIITALFFSYIVAVALSPAVDFLSARKIKHEIAAVLVFLGLILAITILAVPFVPFVLSQTGSLSDNFPSYLGRVGDFLGLKQESLNIAGFIRSEFNSIGRNALALTGKAFGGFFYLTSIIILTFYLLLDHERLRVEFSLLFGENNNTSINKLILEINHKLGLWVRGQIVLSFAVGLASLVGLSVLGIPYAFPLAVIAGALEVVPTIGPIISAIPAVIIALSISPGLAAAVVALHIIVQLLENNILVPNIMRQAVGLNPIFTIIAIMAGGNLMGAVGALLAIPFILVVSVTIKYLRG